MAGQTIKVSFEAVVAVESATEVDEIIQQAYKKLQVHMLDEQIVTYGDGSVQLRRSAAITVKEDSVTVNNDGQLNVLSHLRVSCD
jgi:hypothetical protein